MRGAIVKSRPGGQVYWVPVLVLGGGCSDKETKQIAQQEETHVIIDPQMEANIRGAVGRSAGIPDRWSGTSSAGSGNNPSQNKRKKVQNNERQKTFGTTGPIGEMVVVHCAEDECSHGRTRGQGIRGTVVRNTPTRKKK